MTARIRVYMLERPGPEDARALRRLLERHRVLAVIVIVEAAPHSAGGLARHYRLKPLDPARLLSLHAGSSDQ